MIVKDAMVIIHLAKITLLEKSCAYFKQVMMPEEVHREILAGKERGYEDAQVVEELVRAKKLGVKKVQDETLLKRAREFNLQRGEAEAVALYWQEKADFLASDDDSLRRKSVLLNLKLIGTPAIILKLYKEHLIDKGKLMQSLQELRKIGWFSSSVIDKVLLEAK